MTSITQDRAQISSDATALVLSGVVLAVLFTAKISSRTETPANRTADQASIEVSVQTQPDAMPPAPSPPPPKPVRHRVTPHLHVAEIPIPAEPQPQTSETVPEGAALVASATGPGPTPTVESRPDLEAAYAASLRADIDRRTHAPDSVQYRLRRPSGEVRVEFVLTRDGVAKAVRVLHSSGSSILDDAAQSTVASGRYPPIPAKAFAGEAEHLFAVTIQFRPAG